MTSKMGHLTPKKSRLEKPAQEWTVTIEGNLNSQALEDLYEALGDFVASHRGTVMATQTPTDPDAFGQITRVFKSEPERVPVIALVRELGSPNLVLGDGGEA